MKEFINDCFDKLLKIIMNIMNIMTDNYKLVTLSEDLNKHFDIITIRYRVDILNGLTIHDYYSIVNKIIELNIDDSYDIRINISIVDQNNPTMNCKTDLIKIDEITPDHLFGIVELHSEDDSNFFISETTVFKINKVMVPLENN